MTAVMAIEGLRLELESGVPIVEDVSLTLPAGRILGLVGESGSGKTTTALALLGYTRPGVRRAGGTITVAGRRIDELEEHELRRVRGSLVSYVPQDPAAALNPSFRVGTQIADMIAQHTRGRDRERVVAALEQVELPSGEDFRRRYPHQLSGGQQQRVAIAISLACEPPLVVLDEPTTGLDVVTQARILDEIRRLRNELAVSMVYVSHDLAVIAAIADEIAVMYAGRIVEIGPTRSVLTSPRHPYTRALVDSIPDHRERRRLHALPGVAVAPGERPVGCAFAPRCSQRVDRCVVELPELEEVGAGHRARCFEWLTTPEPRSEAWQARAFASASAEPLLGVEALGAVHRSREGDVIAADDVTFLVSAGECLALVGESGSGKTTIARCVAGLHPRYTGRISLEGALLAPRAKDRPKQVRGSCQLVFQNPYDSLNPRHRIGDAIARPARLLRDISAADAAVEVSRLLEQVRLPPAVATRYPAELSGGERQRVAIARALATRPRLLICDEITSALDVSVQAAVLEILGDLRAKLGLAMLFITHDLGVVASVADRVLVLDRGVICEEGAVEPLLSAPSHEYTRRLVDAAPSLPVREPAAQTRTSRSR